MVCETMAVTSAISLEKSVKNRGGIMTWSLAVNNQAPDCENLIGNGLLNHNCDQMPAPIPEEQFSGRLWSDWAVPGQCMALSENKWGQNRKLVKWKPTACACWKSYWSAGNKLQDKKYFAKVISDLKTGINLCKLSILYLSEFLSDVIW